MNKETRWPGIAFLVIFCVSFATYFNTLGNSFCYDDLATIENNTFIRSWKNLPKLFHRDYFLLSTETSWRPVVTLSYFLDFAFFQERPYGYHLTNILLHCFSACLVMLVFCRLFSWKMGFLSGLLFAVFPLNSEVVNAVSFREDQLVVFFALVSFLFYLRWRKNDGFWFLLAGAFFSFLACLSKENGVIVPFLILGSEVCFPEKSGRKIKKAAFFYGTALFFYLVLRFLVFPSPKKDTTSLLGGSWLVTLLDIPLVYAAYFKKLIWPYPLMAEYHCLWPVSFSWEFAVKSFLILAGVLAVLFFFWRQDRIVFFGLFWLIAGLLPTSNLVPLFNPFAERYLYLPGIGFLIVVARYLSQIRKIWLAAALVVFFVFLYGSISFRRNYDWKDDVSLWRKSISQLRFPTARACLGLGSGLARKKELKSAEIQLRKAIYLKPGLTQAHLVLADVLSDLGKKKQAIRHYLIAIKIEPDLAVAYHNLAYTLEELGNFSAAINYYRKAVQLNPCYAQAYFNLGNLLGKQGLQKEAENAYRQALTIHPGYAQAYYNLGNLFLAQGRLSEAEWCYQQAVRYKPDYSQAYNNLGGTRLRLGKIPGAVSAFQKAISLQPSSGMFHFNLGLALSSNRNWEQAITEYNTALRLLPEEKGKILFLRAEAEFYLQRYQQAAEDIAAARKAGYPVEEEFWNKVHQALQHKN